ncbi:LysR family transcriptional regulator [Streptomyces xanthophaeus]|uniref:LysR family transcriptional regulator n=1 Tax=Streptomyces xanthophaeus TaxID=67385 RepID=UPI003711788C
MELEVRHLRALCAIADAGSLHKAARQLGVSQPSLTTQLRRIERALDGELFLRERTGCRPTPFGRTVLGRARPLLADMAALVAEARALARGPRLRIGSTASRALPGWLRRVHRRLPDTETSLVVDVSANALLRMVDSGQLDVAFVHEVEGSPLRVPAGLQLHVLMEREPQFVSMARDHPAARRPVVELRDLAADRWTVDPSVDGEWDGLRRIFAGAGLDPPVLHADYHTATSLIVSGEAVAPCQPTSGPRDDMAIRPLSGDPLAVRLLLATRPGAHAEVYEDLRAAYREAALRTPPYLAWLHRHASPLLSPEPGAAAGPETEALAGAPGAEVEAA